VITDAETGEIMSAFIDTWQVIKEWQKGAESPLNEIHEIPDPMPQYLWIQADGLPVKRGNFVFNAFGRSRDGTTFISYVNSLIANMALPKLSEMNGQTPSKDSNTPLSRGKYVDSENFLALDHILQGIQIAEHKLILSDATTNDVYIESFIADLLDNLELSTGEMQALLELINHVQSPKTKKELLLQYLEKISTMNEPGLEQLSTLATNEQKLQRLLELAPELPASASSYSLYMKQAASLPDAMDQAAIRELTDLLYAQVRTASVRGTGEGTAINYNESSLVVTSKDAVAIVDFFDPFDYSRSSNELRGVAYRYRALEKGGQEQTGEGIVYENYQSVPSGEPDEFNVITSLGGNMLWVNAGPITFEWSYGSDLGGWVYVDNLNPMVENENSFEDFNLQTILGDTGLEHPLSFTPPFDNAEVTTKFGEQGNFVALRASSTEAPVKAVADGVVLNASRLSWNDGYIISIEHANGLITAYTNLQSKNLPQESQNVKQGDVIGYLGGGAIFPKDVLKLYVRNAPGQFLDPLQLLPELPISSESN
jgi:hypothetical protein